MSEIFSLSPVGYIRSSLKRRQDAPLSAKEGAPDAILEILPGYASGTEGLKPGDEILLITWLHRAERNVLQVHPRRDYSKPLKGVFLTRSPDRPNPLGIHLVTVLKIEESILHVGPLEAIDGTPVVDIKSYKKDSGR